MITSSQAGPSKGWTVMGMGRTLKELAAFSYRGVADALQEALKIISVMPLQMPTWDLSVSS